MSEPHTTLLSSAKTNPSHTTKSPQKRTQRQLQHGIASADKLMQTCGLVSTTITNSVPWIQNFLQFDMSEPHTALLSSAGTVVPPHPKALKKRTQRQLQHGIASADKLMQTCALVSTTRTNSVPWIQNFLQFDISEPRTVLLSSAKTNPHLRTQLWKKLASDVQIYRKIWNRGERLIHFSPFGERLLLLLVSVLTFLLLISHLQLAYSCTDQPCLFWRANRS